MGRSRRAVREVPAMLAPERLRQQSLRLVGPVEACKPPRRTTGSGSEAPLCGPVNSMLSVRWPEIGESGEHIGMRLQSGGRTVAFRQEGQTEVDDVVGEHAAIRVL